MPDSLNGFFLLFEQTLLFFHFPQEIIFPDGQGIRTYFHLLNKCVNIVRDMEPSQLPWVDKIQAVAAIKDKGSSGVFRLFILPIIQPAGHSQMHDQGVSRASRKARYLPVRSALIS